MKFYEKNICQFLNSFIEVLCVIALTTSCNKKEYLNPATLDDSELVSNLNHHIPLETALNTLECFLAEESESRSYIRFVLNTYAVSLPGLNSRGVDSEGNSDELLYVANFVANQGYAILAADDRIPAEILAVADEGNLTENQMTKVVTGITLSKRPVIKGFPTDGPGMFYADGYGNELLMNPNTVELDNDEVGDRLFGNFNFDYDDAVDEDGREIIGDPLNMIDSVTLSDDLEPYIPGLCVSYALNGINGLIDEGDKSHNGGGTEWLLRPNNEWEIPGFETGHSEKTKSYPPEFKTTFQTEVLLYDFRRWHQQAPFNSWYGKTRLWPLGWISRRARAGCFPLAIGKLMAYFKYPNEVYYNGYKVDWERLRNYNPVKGQTQPDFDYDSASALLKAIDNGCEALHFYFGTFTYPGKGTSFMRRIGFENAYTHSYTFEHVKAMVDNRRPLIMMGIPGWNIFDAHVWNIDGYITRDKTVLYEHYTDNRLTASWKEHTEIHMVHCDFGWDRQSNGYFVSGIFDLSNSENIYDYGNKNKTHYTWYLKVVSYDFP